MRIAVIVRPPSTEARMEELRAAVRAVRRDGYRVRVRVTFEGGDARRFARSAVLAGYERIVAAGGDGTVNEVVNGLVSAGGGARLGVIPLGTANDFARGLVIPHEAEAALRNALEGAPREVDVARVNRRCFVNVSTGGFGASATKAATRGAKRRFGAFAYLLRGVRNVLDMEPVRARFIADGEVVHDGAFVFFAVGNARLTGGGNPVAPRAQLHDGRLDMTILRAVSRSQLLTLLPQLRAGTHLDNEHVCYVRARELRVEGDASIPVNADGEAIAGTSFRYDVLGRPVTVMVPRDAV